MSSVPLNIGFRRTLIGDKWTSWLHLVHRLMMVRLSADPDSFTWKLINTGVFSVKSMYRDLMDGHIVFPRKYLWKIKIPLKIKIFMWFLNRKVLLTKDNLAKRNWSGCKQCCFCGLEETIQHLLISCPYARLVWRIVHVSFNLPPPTNVTNMFGNWLNGVDKKLKAQIRVRVSAFCWAIWNCRNDIVFNKTRAANIL